MSAEPLSPEKVRVLMTRHRAVLNKLDSHLGCVTCRGPLTDGRCLSCDPQATEPT